MDNKRTAINYNKLHTKLTTTSSRHTASKQKTPTASSSMMWHRTETWFLRLSRWFIDTATFTTTMHCFIGKSGLLLNTKMTGERFACITSAEHAHQVTDVDSCAANAKKLKLTEESWCEHTQHKREQQHLFCFHRADWALYLRHPVDKTVQR